MNRHHENLIRVLIACQIAVLEHADENLAGNRAADALMKHLAEATKLARKLIKETS